MTLRKIAVIGYSSTLRPVTSRVSRLAPKVLEACWVRNQGLLTRSTSPVGGSQCIASLWQAKRLCTNNSNAISFSWL
jgi:hypothetical protein